MVQAVTFNVGDLVRVKDVKNSDGWLGHIVKKDASWGSFYGVAPVRDLGKCLRVHASDLIHSEVAKAVSLNVGDQVKLRGWGDEWFNVALVRESGKWIKIDVASVDGKKKLVELSVPGDVMAQRQGDPAQSPTHYDLPGGIQVIDLIRDQSFLRGNLIKYIFRAPHKGNELEDLKKAAEYLKWEIERVENERG